MNAATFCETEPFGDGFRCPSCRRPHRLDRKGGVPHRPCEAPILVYNDLAESGPCRNRGETIAVQTCQLCSGRGKLVDSFLCLADRGAAGPPSLASEEQWTLWQNPIPRTRSVCSWCPRYVAAAGESAAPSQDATAIYGL